MVKVCEASECQDEDDDGAGIGKPDLARVQNYRIDDLPEENMLGKVVVLNQQRPFLETAFNLSKEFSETSHQELGLPNAYLPYLRMILSFNNAPEISPFYFLSF
ncbi:hypothetical protein Pyn_07675 [Prunus yedoensis var. nudiflora]|uniref:Uncharacterized protein n=1 Tax=Prunus yedoensis var. nudiflora TaxID=2094558 RepID=A0A314ZIC0_PRUYE|nr:hypothetical protein Pyn_07675 [Prunus yedoensis var. nudiflora]